MQIHFVIPFNTIIISLCVKFVHVKYEGWNFNFGNTPLDWIQELLE